MQPVRDRPSRCLCGCGNPLPLSGHCPKRFLRGHGTIYLQSAAQIPCACGCGQLTTPLKKNFTERRYVKGHGPRGENHHHFSALPHMKDKAEVTCISCSNQYLKRRDTLKGWDGRCRSCVARNPDREAIARNDRARKEAYSLIHATLKRLRHKKAGKTVDLLGYSPLDLYNHLTVNLKPGMSWERRGEWHIDHVKPVSAFIRAGITDPKIINALSNLQPLWKFENESKGGLHLVA